MPDCITAACLWLRSLLGLVQTLPSVPELPKQPSSMADGLLCLSSTLLSGSEFGESSDVRWDNVKESWAGAASAAFPSTQVCGFASREVGGSVQGKEQREAAHSNYVFLELPEAKPLTLISPNDSFWSHSHPRGKSGMSSSPFSKGEDLFLTGDYIISGPLAFRKGGWSLCPVLSTQILLPPVHLLCLPVFRLSCSERRLSQLHGPWLAAASPGRGSERPASTASLSVEERGCASWPWWPLYQQSASRIISPQIGGWSGKSSPPNQLSRQLARTKSGFRKSQQPYGGIHDTEGISCPA